MKVGLNYRVPELVTIVSGIMRWSLPEFMLVLRAELADCELPNLDKPNLESSMKLNNCKNGLDLMDLDKATLKGKAILVVRQIKENDLKKDLMGVIAR